MHQKQRARIDWESRAKGDMFYGASGKAAGAFLPAVRPERRAIETQGAMRRRLQDIGLISGTRVECVGVSPLGDPAAYLIRGAVIALRREDSDGVQLCT